MPRGHVIHPIPNHLIKVIQFQEVQHLINITTTASSTRNRLGAHGRRRRRSSRSTKQKEMAATMWFRSAQTKSTKRWRFREEKDGVGPQAKLSGQEGYTSPCCRADEGRT